MNPQDTELYRKVYLIRSAELMIQKHYLEDEMKTPMHMSMGEEAIVAGICLGIETGGSGTRILPEPRRLSGQNHGNRPF